MPDEKQVPSGPYDDQIIEGHKYDGISEYDNPMPGWWVGLFYLSIVASVVYVLGIYVFDFVDTYEEDLAQSQAELMQIRETYAAANPSATFDDDALAEYVDSDAAIIAGAATYNTYCAACHKPDGGGLIGPNLTDDYYIHGGTNQDMFLVLKNGVVDKGMAAWEGVLTAEQRAELVAYIRSLQGTDPPNAKAPEGEFVAYAPAAE
jgi:cytochrome c oxidase cbb3-type subunit 3